MRLRMLPANTIFQAFPRAVRDLAKQFRKDIELIVEGGETELDKKVLEEINDPLVHIMRNAVDHGIEDPETRVALGKPAHGTVRLGRASGGRPHPHRDQRRRRRYRSREGPSERGPQGLHHRGRGDVDVGPRGAVHDLRGRLLHGGDHHRDLRPGRGHGRGARVRRREAQGLAGPGLSSGQGHDVQADDSAHARDHPCAHAQGGRSDLCAADRVDRGDPASRPRRDHQGRGPRGHPPSAPHDSARAPVRHSRRAG